MVVLDSNRALYLLYLVFVNVLSANPISRAMPLQTDRTHVVAESTTFYQASTASNEREEPGSPFDKNRGDSLPRNGGGFWSTLKQSQPGRVVGGKGDIVTQQPTALEFTAQTEGWNP